MFKPSIPQKSITQASQQISVERLNESKYLNLEAYFSKWNLDGFKAIMRRQADGEAQHARKIIDYLDERNANYTVDTLTLAPLEFATFGEVLNFWLITEQKTTEELAARADGAWVNDPISRKLWIEMLEEQKEEEKEPMYWLTRADELGILDLNLDTFNMSNPVEYIKRQSLIMLDNEAKGD